MTLSSENGTAVWLDRFARNASSLSLPYLAADLRAWTPLTIYLPTRGTPS